METNNKTYTPKNDSDDLNPAFMFNGIATDLLAAIVNGEINATALAAQELANRGLSPNGVWVGFAKAKELMVEKLMK
jgi:hypothetical protein